MSTVASYDFTKGVFVGMFVALIMIIIIANVWPVSQPMPPPPPSPTPSPSPAVASSGSILGAANVGSSPYCAAPLLEVPT